MKTISDLVELMTRKASTGGTPYFVHNGQSYILMGADREDGSGTSFNLRAKDHTGKVVSLYVKLTR